MNYLKRFGLMFAAVAFVMCIFAVSSQAQWRDRSWRGRDNYGQNERRWRNRDYRYGRINGNEYRRLQRQRMRLYNMRNRYYYNDGYISNRERRKLYRNYYRYRRNVYRDRRDW